MNDRIAFAKTLASESKAFENVIKAITNPEWKHPDDPKGKTAMQMAVMLVHSAAAFVDVLEKGELGGENASPFEKPTDVTMAAQMLHDYYAKASKIAEETDDATWELPSVMLMNGKKMWESTRGGMSWGLLLDAVHHRGQLSTYLRPMGSKVPSIYGPSGDDMGGIEMPA